MTASELLEKLQEVIRDHGEDTEVRIASQPQWAFENSISGAYTNHDCLEVWQYSKEPDAKDIEADDLTPVFYIYEGHQIGYLPTPAHEGWNI